MNAEAVSTLGNAFTREGGEEYRATNFQAKCKVQIPKVVRVHIDTVLFAETRMGFLACSTGSCSRNHSGTRHRGIDTDGKGAV